MILLLIMHILGDFYFQSNNMVKNKKSSSTWLLKHSSTYIFMFIPIILFVDDLNKALLSLFCIFSTHFLIDKFLHKITFFIFNKKVTKFQDYCNFYIDQLVHIAILIILNNYIQINILNHNYFKYIIILLFLGMPSSIIVTKTLLLIGDDIECEFKIDEGTIIGFIERYLILFLGLANAISGIGLVIAAKTMVRYGQFDNSETNSKKSFRTKYLIGTLTSVMLAVIGYLLILIN